MTIRAARNDDFGATLDIINAASVAYRGHIPADCWHEPYMSTDALRAEIDAGVRFDVVQLDDAVAAVMGIQAVRAVDLIRHAYTAPMRQGRGLGSELLAALRGRSERPILIGTWAAATWAIGFYGRHGFALVPDAAKADLLRTYWTVPERQIETSVVLAAPHLTEAGAARLLADEMTTA